jgi:hypothetical protein
LAALLNSQRIALVAVCPTGVCFLHLISFAAVHIPRLVTWRGVGEILVFVDHSILNR